MDFDDSPEELAYRARSASVPRRARRRRRRARASADSYYAQGAVGRCRVRARASVQGVADASCSTTDGPASRGRRRTAAGASTARASRHLQPRASALRRAGRHLLGGHRHDRPDAHRARHRGTEAALPATRCCAATRCGASCSPSPAPASDLAGLRTTAVRDGDEWIVNGQKVWNSGAHYSDWGILLDAHRSRRAQAPRHHLLRGRHAHAGHRRAAVATDHRRRALQRGLPHRRAHPAREHPRSASTPVGARCSPRSPTSARSSGRRSRW